MASSLQPKIQTFTASGTIVAGHALKFGADKKHVVECTAVSDKSMGVAVGSASSGDPVEVYRPGGGGKVVCQTTVALGDPLVSHTDGTLKPSSTTGDRIIAWADDAGVVGDVIPVTVSQSLHY